MSKVHGARAILYLAQYNLSGYSNDISQSMKMEVVDVSPQGQTPPFVHEYIPGLLSWTLSQKGFWDFAVGNPEDVFNELLGTLGQVIYSPSGGGVGEVAYGGYSSPFAGGDVMSPLNGAVGVSLAVTGAHVLARCKSLGRKTATAGENGTAQNLGAAGTDGVEAFLAVTAFTGTDATIKVQSSADGSTGWADRVTFTQITAVTSERLVAGTTTDQYLRYVLSGTFSSISFLVIARNVGVHGWN